MKCRLKELREASGITQLETAGILRVSQNMISNVEKGTREVPIELAMKAAEYFEVSLEYFLGLSENKGGYNEKITALLEKNSYKDFIAQYNKLKVADKEAVNNLIHNLKKVQDQYRK